MKPRMTILPLNLLEEDSRNEFDAKNGGRVVGGCTIFRLS